MAIGRPSKITPEIQAEIVKWIKIGSYVETAAIYAGISKQTLYQWLKKGKQRKRGPYRSFRDAVGQAVAEAQLRDLQNVQNYVDGFPAVKRVVKTYVDPQTQMQVTEITETTETIRSVEASKWRLERRDPKRWGRRDAHSLTGAGGGPLRVLFEETDTWGSAADQKGETPADLEERELTGEHGGNGKGNGNGNGNGDGESTDTLPEAP